MTDWGLRLCLNFKQAVGSENIYGVFNVFVNNPIYPCAKNIRYIRAIRVQKHTHPHGKICVHL